MPAAIEPATGPVEENPAPVKTNLVSAPVDAVVFTPTLIAFWINSYIVSYY